VRRRAPAARVGASPTIVASIEPQYQPSSRRRQRLTCRSCTGFPSRRTGRYGAGWHQPDRHRFTSPPAPYCTHSCRRGTCSSRSRRGSDSPQPARTGHQPRGTVSPDGGTASPTRPSPRQAPREGELPCCTELCRRLHAFLSLAARFYVASARNHVVRQLPFCIISAH
jgi:hypothetical protein